MKYILMDLDGTITNPKVGITKSFQYALKHFDINIEDLDTLTKHIGPPLLDTFRREYGFSETETQKAVEKYREYFNRQGILENEVYSGMKQLLSKLNQAEMKVIVATSKPESLAVRILEHFGLAEYFQDICGADFDETRSSKEDVIQYALEKNKINEISQVVMVGDRKYDVEGAKAHGMKCIGVLYGFGSRQELEEAGADLIAETVEKVYERIIEL